MINSQKAVAEDEYKENSHKEPKFSDCFVKVEKMKSKDIIKIIPVNIPQEFFPLKLQNYDLLDAQNQDNKTHQLFLFK